MSEDPYTTDCVICQKPCAEHSDFCRECLDAGAEEANFGRCYQCHDFQDHENCVGVPCQCPCPPPDQRQRDAEIAAALAKLTPHERQILGH
jgi:hypothetical protein